MPFLWVHGVLRRERSECVPIRTSKIRDKKLLGETVGDLDASQMRTLPEVP